MTQPRLVDVERRGRILAGIDSGALGRCALVNRHRERRAEVVVAHASAVRAHAEEVRHHPDVLLPTPALDVIVPHPPDVVRRGPELRRYRREQAGGVPEGHDLVVPAVYDERRTSHVPRALLVVE